MSRYGSMEEKQVAVQLHVKRFTTAFIARQLNRSRRTVHIWISEWINGRFLRNEKRIQNVNCKLTAQQVFKALNYFIDNPFDSYKECIKNLKLPIHRTTLAKLLSKNGIRNYVACMKQFLSMQNQIKRMKFAINYLSELDSRAMVPSMFH